MTPLPVVADGPAHVGQHQVLEADRRDGPGRIEDRAVRADQQDGLLVGVAFGDDFLAGGEAAGVAARPGQPAMRCQQVADLMLGDGLHQALRELPPGQRVEGGDRLIEDEQIGPLGHRQG
jgi:hypothetical protein